jgi:hypothetical protein
MILGIMGSETPRWLKLCCQENYFSAYSYRQTKIREYRCHCCCCCCLFIDILLLSFLF